MALISRVITSNSNIIRCKILDSASAVGAGKTGLTNATAGLIISTAASIEAAPVVYTQAGGLIDTIATLGTYAAPTATHCNFKEYSAANHPGVYELQFADARFAVSGQLLVSISGAAGIVQTDFIIDQSFGGIDASMSGAIAQNGIIDMGTAPATSSNTLTLRAAALFSNNSLTGATLMAFGSTQGYWQQRQILSNVGVTATVDAWSVAPSGTVTYIIAGTPPSSASLFPSVNTVQVRGQTVNGVGSIANPWGP